LKVFYSLLFLRGKFEALLKCQPQVEAAMLAALPQPRIATPTIPRLQQQRMEDLQSPRDYQIFQKVKFPL
jgi:hypothetical protein